MSSLFEDDDELMDDVFCSDDKMDIESTNDLGGVESDRKRVGKRDIRRLIEERLEEKRLLEELEDFDFSEFEDSDA